MNKVELSDPIALRIPIDVLGDIEKIATASDRTRSWVIVRALKLYLASEGTLARRRTDPNYHPAVVLHAVTECSQSARETCSRRVFH